jgi:Xaa-Pro aminopeptidase
MKYFAFLEEELNKPDHGLDEYSGARKVENYRTFGEFYKGPSFDTISSIGANGAVIHYKPDLDTAVKLNNDEIYLLDSGGQYLDGTTDITRCGHFGGKAPTAFQKEAYTRVMMGTLDLERCIWPSEGTYAGKDFDYLARRHLFNAGLDYKHGTGHGVGSLLCVHEGPIGINRRTEVKLIPGHCVSDEPGYYHDGEFGIRVENVMMVQQHPKLSNSYYFENLTVAPYCRELIDTSILGQDFIDYINAHHEKCLEKLTPLLKGVDESDAKDIRYRTCRS